MAEEFSYRSSALYWGARSISNTRGVRTQRPYPKGPTPGEKAAAAGLSVVGGDSRPVLRVPNLTAEELDISVVMPCLNEAESVGTCVAKAFEGIRLSGLVGEVVVADNGSWDGSVEIARRAGARLFVHQPLRGYGNAYRKGFAEARGHIVVMGDSDDSYDFTQIPALIAPIQAGADYVLGSRFRGQIEPGAMTWSHRHIGNPLLTGMLNVLFGLKSSDAHSGLRAFRREALQQLSLSCEGMELASEIVVKAARAGLEVAEVPIVYYPRTGESKLQSLPDAWRHMRYLLLLSPSTCSSGPGYCFSGPASPPRVCCSGWAPRTWPALERPRRVRHAVGYAITGAGLVRQDLRSPRRPRSGVPGQPLRGAGVHVGAGVAGQRRPWLARGRYGGLLYLWRRGGEIA